MTRKITQIFPPKPQLYAIRGGSAMNSLKGWVGGKKDYIVGLDIGTSSVKLAQFVKKEDGLHLVKTDLKEIKRTNDEPLHEQEVVSVLKDLFKGIDVKKSKIIVTINCPQTAVKKVIAPYMPKAELRNGIILEAKNYFPFPLDQSLLDFEILGDVVEKGVRKYEVVIATSPIKTVDKYLSLLGKLGIKPAMFVSSSYALQRLVQHLYSSTGKEAQTGCFIDIGKSYTELIISKRGRFEFSRKIPITASDFTKAMTAVLVSDRGKTQLSFDEAEKIKLETGIPTECELKIIDDKISTSQIVCMMMMPLEQLVSEIERCFDYYREEVRGGAIGSVTLFGGGAGLEGLVKSLSERIGMDVRLGDSLEGLNCEKDAVKQRDKVSHRLAMAIGAALSSQKGINLLPPEIKEETKRQFKRGTIEAAATALLLILIFIYTGVKIQTTNFQKRISVANLELSSLQPGLKKARIKVLGDRLLADEPPWEDIFKELSNLAPDYIHLTNLSMKHNTLIMKGTTTSSKGEEKFISDFMLVLENGIFNNVKLIATRDLGKGSGTEFELRCWVDYR